MTPDELGLVARLTVANTRYNDPQAGDQIRWVKVTDADLLLAILAERDALQQTHNFVAFVLGAEDAAR